MWHKEISLSLPAFSVACIWRMAERMVLSKTGLPNPMFHQYYNLDILLQYLEDNSEYIWAWVWFSVRRDELTLHFSLAGVYFWLTDDVYLLSRKKINEVEVTRRKRSDWMSVLVYKKVSDWMHEWVLECVGEVFGEWVSQSVFRSVC